MYLVGDFLEPETYFKSSPRLKKNWETLIYSMMNHCLVYKNLWMDLFFFFILSADSYFWRYCLCSSVWEGIVWNLYSAHHPQKCYSSSMNWTCCILTTIFFYTQNHSMYFWSVYTTKLTTLYFHWRWNCNNFLLKK